MHILVCDIGGTLTRVAIYDIGGNAPHRCEVVTVENQLYDSLPAALDACCNQLRNREQISAICLAVAAPVRGSTVKLTNSPWVVDVQDIQNRFSSRHVFLINDFIAQGHAVNALTADDILVLQEGSAEYNGPIAVIGAGTGFGQVLVKRDDHKIEVYASEGGHVDFAPRDSQQIDLLRYLLDRQEQVVIEHLLSGHGLHRLYCFLRDSNSVRENPVVTSAFIQDDPAAVITQNAHQDELCRETIRLFCSVYGAHAANIGLSYLATGGLYLTGGVTQHLLGFLGDGVWMSAFRRHTSMAHILRDMPVNVVKYDYPGLLGAALYTANKLSR